MNVHTLFVEPANYTQDLIENVYQKLGITYSFLNSNSIATDNTAVITSAEHLFDKNNLWNNIKFLWNCSLKNDLVIVNGYNHFAFIFMWLFSLINSCNIGIESDTPYKAKTGIIGVVKKMYLNIIFSNKKILGLPGGTLLHRDLFLKYGMPEKRIFFLPMMVNNDKYLKICTNKLLPMNEDIKFIFVGRLVPEKNIQALVKSFLQIIKVNKNVELNIVGDGECKTELEIMIVGTSQIKLLGKKFGKDLLDVYSNAHLLVLPSSFEPWGLVVNEAMASGVAVICSSAVGASYDLVQKPNTGWVFNHENDSDLNTLLVNILENPDIITEKSKRAEEFMANYWNYDLYIKSLKQLIDYVKKN